MTVHGNQSRSALTVTASDASRWRSLRNRARPRARQAAEQRPRPWYRVNLAEDADVAVIDIYDEIGYWGTTAADFIDELRAITANQIELHINSPGGDVYDGIAIYSALVDHPATVDVRVDALAASAASFIAQAGDRVTMGRNAEMMIHDAWGLCVGNAADMREMAELLDKASDNIASIYAARAGNGGTKTWRARMEGETWYSAQETVDVGLADKVAKTEPRRGTTTPAEDRWDLSLFAYKGRSEAPAPDRSPDASLGRPAPPGAPFGAIDPPADDPVADVENATCPECEADVPDDATTCPSCGADLSETDDAEKEPDALAGIDWESLPTLDRKALHVAMLDAADGAGLGVNTAPLREALEEFAYDADALRGHLLDMVNHVDPAPDLPPTPKPMPRHVDIDVLADSLREALSS